MLKISFADGNTFRFPCEFLRVYSPSADVSGHGPDQEVLQVGKKDVENAILPTFSDGHSTGIYSWDLFYDYGLRQEEMWRQYLKRMEAAGASREPACGPIEQRPKSK